MVQPRRDPLRADSALRHLRRRRRDADYIWAYPAPKQIETHCRRLHPDLTDGDPKMIDQSFFAGGAGGEGHRHRGFAELMRRAGTIAVIAGLVLGAGATQATAFKGFETPSHNIGCVLDAQGARCDIGEHSWPLPKKPKSCEFDYGGSLFIGEKGRGEYGCVSDSAMGAGPVLPYGESIRKGRFECHSGEAGVRCVNRRDSHGFFLSRQSVRLF